MSTIPRVITSCKQCRYKGKSGRSHSETGIKYPICYKRRCDAANGQPVYPQYTGRFAVLPFAYKSDLRTDLRTTVYTGIIPDWCPLPTIADMQES